MSNQPPQNNNNNNPPQNNPFGSRFGSRPGQAPAAPPPPPNPPQNNPFGRRPAFGAPANQRSWHIQPLIKTVVRFELKGLGDPFYRLLDHDLNPDFGDSRNVVATLEQGGGTVNDMREMLDEVWESYHLEGAFLVYNWNTDLWRSLITPPPQPPQQQQDTEDSDDNNNQPPPQQNQAPLFHCVRAIDLELVLNVLARSRSQLLIARAPLVFSQQYLTRSIMSDDPRLVALARATGCLEE